MSTNSSALPANNACPLFANGIRALGADLSSVPLHTLLCARDGYAGVARCNQRHIIAHGGRPSVSSLREHMSNGKQETFQTLTNLDNWESLEAFFETCDDRL